VLALVDAVVCTGDLVLPEHAVLIDGDQVSAVVPAGEVPSEAEAVALGGAYIAPGLVDLQVNGGGDLLLTDDPTPATLARIVNAHRRLGSTSVVPTLISSDGGTMEAAVAAARAAIGDRLPGCVGLHVEGPFLNPDEAGIHDPRQMRRMTAEDADLLASLNAPMIVTLAPERVEPSLVERLAAAGVVVSAGHSDAEEADLDAAVARGLRLVTHLYNAMSGLRARQPGLVGAALSDDRVACGLIADGHHVASSAIRVALRCKRPGGLFLVSDAMPPVGGRVTSFRIADVEIIVRDGRCLSTDGVLAGSAASLADCVHHIARLRVPVPDALRMASTVPADLIGLGGEIGRIAPGRVADLVVVDAAGRVSRVMIAGRFVS
jgi:N-acetylglucosamine-6-phosphate deacetylase